MQRIIVNIGLAALSMGAMLPVYASLPADTDIILTCDSIENNCRHHALFI
jgi:hypothetical protein